jgi:hypothetical protein
MCDENGSPPVRQQTLGELCISLIRMIASPAGSGLAAAEAFDEPPVSATARRCRIAATGLFVVAAALFLAAAIVHVAGLPPLVGELMGGGGIVLIFGAIYCGMRYRSLNQGDDQP